MARGHFFLLTLLLAAVGVCCMGAATVGLVRGLSRANDSVPLAQKAHLASYAEVTLARR